MTFLSEAGTAATRTATSTTRRTTANNTTRLLVFAIRTLGWCRAGLFGFGRRSRRTGKGRHGGDISCEEIYVVVAFSFSWILWIPPEDHKVSVSVPQDMDFREAR